jgi:superfamily II DNA or RNA helicase
MYNSFLPHEKKFQEWIKDKFPGVSPKSLNFIRHILGPGREKALWRNQQEGVLRAIYAYEILGKKDLLLNIVTGGGKTQIIAALIAWLRMVYEIKHFIVLVPNVIVRDRLQRDFKNAKIFQEFSLFPDYDSNFINDLELHILGEGRTGMLESGIILGNIQQLYTRGGGANPNLAYIMNFLGDLAIFNDEAHNTPAPEYTNVLLQLAKKAKFRLDTTATPDRADGQSPDSEMIYEYGIQDALRDDLVKSVVVYQPDIKTVELTYTDVDTGRQAKVEQIDWDEIDRRGISAVQWVTDEKPLKQQIKIALQRLEEQKERAKGRYKPVLFIVSVCIKDARSVTRVMNEKFKVPTLLVTEEEGEEERRAAAHIGHKDSPYEAIVSVLMLREGWDVPEVSTILLLRKFSSQVYGQQVIGRGLRRIIREEGEREILTVVDHPKLEHGWLWKKVSAKIKENVSTTAKYDLDEDLPKQEKPQELIDPEKLIEVPEPEGSIEPDFEDLLKETQEVPINEDWYKILDSVSYSRKKIEITDVKLRGLRKFIPGEERMTEYLSDKPEDEEESVDSATKIEYSAEELRDQLREEVLEMTAELLLDSGFSSIYKSLLYDKIMNHINIKLLKGKTSGLSTDRDLEFALYKLPEVRRVFKRPGVVPSIIRYPNADAAK